jgi:hypothetical protein
MIRKITAESIVEAVAGSPRGHEAVRERFFPLLANGGDHITNCALTQLAILVEPGEPHMEHLMRHCLERRHFPAVRAGTPLWHVMKQLREATACKGHVFGHFHAHQGGFPDLVEVERGPGPFQSILQQLLEVDKKRILNGSQ